VIMGKFFIVAGVILAFGLYAVLNSNFFLYVFAGVGVGQIALDVAKSFIDLE